MAHSCWAFFLRPHAHVQKHKGIREEPRNTNSFLDSSLAQRPPLPPIETSWEGKGGDRLKLLPEFRAQSNVAGFHFSPVPTLTPWRTTPIAELAPASTSEAGTASREITLAKTFFVVTLFFRIFRLTFTRNSRIKDLRAGKTACTGRHEGSVRNSPATCRRTPTQSAGSQEPRRKLERGPQGESVTICHGLQPNEFFPGMASGQTGESAGKRATTRARQWQAGQEVSPALPTKGRGSDEFPKNHA